MVPAIASAASQAPDNEYHLAGLLALFEDDFSIDWVIEISGWKATDILEVLDELDQNDIIEKKRPGVYHFKHQQKRLQLLSTVRPDEKEKLHRSISEILFRDIKDENEANLKAAGHLLNLKNDENGCRHLLAAGNIHRKSHQYQKALKCYQKVIIDLDQEESDAAYDLFIKSAIGYTRVFMVDSEIGSAVPLLKRAIRKAESRNAAADVALLKMNLALSEWLCTDIDTAIEHFNEGWALAQTLDDPDLKGKTFLFKSFFLFIQGKIREVVQNCEKIHSDIDKYPRNGFPLMAANTIATCYAYNGQIQRGMAMLEALYDQYRNNGNFYASCNTGLMIGSVFIELGRLTEAIQHLEFSLEKAVQTSNNLHISLIHLKLAYAQYRNNKIEKSLEHLRAALKLRRKKNITNKYNTYHNSELFWAMDLGDYPAIEDFSIDEEISRAQESKNILVKGIAYRYRALMEERKQGTRENILDLMLMSEKFLEESGHEIQLARTRMETARLYLSMGMVKKARQVIRKSSEILNHFMQHQVPDNLRFLLKDMQTDKRLIEEIMKLGQGLAAIDNLRDLLRQILAVVNQITGAERGAVFLVSGEDGNAEVILRGARNLTVDDIARSDFSSSMDMIKKSVSTGEPQVYLTSPPAKVDLMKKKEIHSRICVPMKIRETIIGVLYVDNRIFPSAFKKSDIKILHFFSVAAAIALENARMRQENQALIHRLEEERQCMEKKGDHQHCVVEFIGKSEAVRQVLKNTEKVATTDASVLVLGETGVGKELIAAAIHNRSLRSQNAFIRVNCSAFPETLITSELFGHEKGSFTGAIERRIGRFEQADGGTLFLDEIGDISHEVQVRLLRVLQSREFERIGGRKTIRSDFRLVAATNRDLEKEVREGKFREDLFYRLNVLSIRIPPLRERREDIPLLVDHFLNQYARKHGRPVSRISDSNIKKLVAYDWPGNVRELKNVIERGAILSSGRDFKIPEFNRTRTACCERRNVITLAENEKRHIILALAHTNGKIRGPGGAAELLDINHNTLYSRMKKLGIRRPAL